MMAWRIQPSLLLAFVARSPCLCLVGGNCLVSASVSKRCLSSCRQRSLLYFSLIIELIYFLVIPYWVIRQDTLLVWFFPAEELVALSVWCRITTFATFPPVFLVNLCSAFYSLSNDTFIVSRVYALFELHAAKNKSNPNEGDCFIFHYKYLFKLMQDYCNWKSLLRWANGDTR
jgi:hypothetical protein